MKVAKSTLSRSEWLTGMFFRVVISVCSTSGSGFYIFVNRVLKDGVQVLQVLSLRALRDFISSITRFSSTISLKLLIYLFQLFVSTLRIVYEKFVRL